MSGPPPRVVVEDTSEYENAQEVTGLERPKLDKGKRVMSMPPPTVVVQRASEDLARPISAPKLDKGKRVVSMPSAEMANLTSTQREMHLMVRRGRVLRMPQKLAGERGRGRWSEVPTNWRHGTVDPLRCHSVDQLPPPDWQ